MENPKIAWCWDVGEVQVTSFQPTDYSHFSEREENVCLSISCLFQTIGALRKKIVDVIGSEYLTKDTAVSQKCQQKRQQNRSTPRIQAAFGSNKIRFLRVSARDH